MSDRPNIVEIIWHDLGDWLGCYNRADVTSPSLDAFAEQGVVLENHFCVAPQCSASRATIMTGRYPQSHGVMGLVHRGWRYNPGERDLPSLLGDADYQTALVGFQHERHDPSELAYHQSWTQFANAVGKMPAEEAHADVNAARAVEYLQQRGQSGAPFFLSVGFTEVHRPFGAQYDPGVAHRLTVPGFLPDQTIVRKDMATFYHGIRRADAAVGRILRALRETGLEENTLAFFTTDHGPEIPRAKMTVYDPGIKVAMLVRFPGVFPAGARVQALTSHVDLLPTILQAANVPIPANVQGRSMFDLLAGKTRDHRDAIFAQMTWHGGEYDPMRCVRTPHFKYIRNYLPGWPPQMGGPYVQRYGDEFINRHFARARPAEELYDLQADVWEQTNLADDPAHQSLKRELSARLLGWEQSIDDPILRGHIVTADRSKVGSGCVWAKFPPHDPHEQEFRFGIVRTRDFVDNPL
jgi:arylsulfatase A-like enzyme